MNEDNSTKYSPSKLDTYKNCPRLYKYRYIDRIPREKKSIEAYLGTAVHTALEELYDGVAHGRVMTLPEVLAVYEEAFKKGLDDTIVIRDKRYTLDNWREVGAGCVKSYYEQYRPFDQDKTVAVEKRIGFPLVVADADAGTMATVQIEGFVDRLALAPDGAFEIHDYKTGKTLPTQADQDEDWQLAIYNLGVFENWPDAIKAPPVRLKWHYLRHGKTITSIRTDDQLRDLQGSITQLIRDIKRDREFEPKKSALCDWCDYREICPLWKHVEAYQALPEAKRSAESGVQLVDEYASLDRQKKKLNGDIAEIEAKQEVLIPQLIAYGEEHEARVIQGTGYQVEIKTKEEYKMPNRTQEPEHVERMEQELKRTDIWPEVSRLDGKALMDGFKAKTWPQPVIQLIESWIDKFIRHEVVKKISLHKNKASDDD